MTSDTGFVAYLWPGQPLVSGFILWLSSSFSPCLPLSQLGVVSQDSGIGLQDMVEHMEAVRTAHIWALLKRAGIWKAQVLVGAHEGQQLHLEGADLFGVSHRTERLVQILPAALQKFMENSLVCVFLVANGAEPFKRIGAEKISQFWPLNPKKKKGAEKFYSQCRDA